jgi:hypothetical protein
MRVALIAIGVIVASLVAATAIVRWDAPLPPIAPIVEQTCADTMRRARPDLTFAAPGRKGDIPERKIPTVTLGELPLHNGHLVRVAGLLHAEFEWSALYPSRTALEDGWHAPWVALSTLFPDEPYWQTKGPWISDRCVVLEGTYSRGAGGHLGLFNGAIRDVLRLDVWSTPHRPFVTTPPSPPQQPLAEPNAACSEKPSAPEKLPDAAAGRLMLEGFNNLYATGDYQLGYCTADVRVTETGMTESVHVIRPPNIDRRVESIVAGTIMSWRYKPATACGRPIPFTMSVGIGHCPSRQRTSPKGGLVVR